MNVNDQKELTDLRDAKQRVIEQYGEWTSHNIQITDDIHTISSNPRGDEVAARRIVQTVADVTDHPFHKLRVLDLACLEGLYAVELARHGASVVGVEVREQHLAKARFAKEALHLNNLELVLDDVRNVSLEKYGAFDVVLCLGILYHLDAPDVFQFIERIFEVCTRCLIIDTHVSQADDVSENYGGHTYWGRYYIEHNDDESNEVRKSKSWASIDNARSFWFTRPSLLNVLFHAGFTSVYECHSPKEPGRHADRITLVAIKGEPQRVISSPAVSATPLEDWPEHSPSRFAGVNARKPIKERMSSLLPASLKRLGKKVFTSNDR